MTPEDPDERTLPTGLLHEAVNGAVAEIGFDLERIYKLESEGVMGKIIVKDSEGAIVLQRGELCRILGSPIVMNRASYIFIGVAFWQDIYYPIFKDADDRWLLVNREDIDKFVAI